MSRSTMHLLWLLDRAALLPTAALCTLVLAGWLAFTFWS